jgi:predicted transcriptional regulator
MEKKFMPDALISIKPKYVDRFLSGQKVIEIRNRKINLANDSKLWIYATLPKASIQTIAYVKQVEIDTPKIIWEKHRELVGISEDTYLRYVNGSRKISAIIMRNIQRLNTEIKLKEIRDLVPGFQPPQFIKYMDVYDPPLSALLSILSR